MSELISGKEALIALANGEDVEIKFNYKEDWHTVNRNDAYAFSIFLDERGSKFRLKPRTITINSIEVPAPADDKDYHHQGIWILNSLEPKEYGYVVLDITDELPRYWWKSEDEIKQVVAALRSIFSQK